MSDRPITALERIAACFSPGVTTPPASSNARMFSASFKACSGAPAAPAPASWDALTAFAPAPRPFATLPPMVPGTKNEATLPSAPAPVSATVRSASGLIPKISCQPALAPALNLERALSSGFSMRPVWPRISAIPPGMSVIPVMKSDKPTARTPPCPTGGLVACPYFGRISVLMMELICSLGMASGKLTTPTPGMFTDLGIIRPYDVKFIEWERSHLASS